MLFHVNINRSYGIRFTHNYLRGVNSDGLFPLSKSKQISATMNHLATRVSGSWIYCQTKLGLHR